MSVRDLGDPAYHSFPVRRVRGADLKVGDTIEVWWQPHRDTIIKLEPYTGKLAHLFSEGAQIASFAILRSGMTIDNSDIYERIAP